ncbi:hypothetical protein [Aquipuribacter sp. SD81]|uniref:hypothetical protein n=1 Tax=Aquipuribacter sp. SD81 TaxID=3127703 RepID=UPI003016FE6B
MADICIDTEGLRDTGRALRQAALDLDGARSHSLLAAQRVGQPVLAAAVEELSSSWDDRRARIVEDIAFLADAATTAGDTYEVIDTELAAALRGQR